MRQENNLNDITSGYVPGCLAPYDGPPTDSFDSEDPLPKKLQTHLERLVQTITRRDLYPRRFEIRQARLQRFYYRGDQHLIWNNDANTWDVASRGNFNSDDDSDNEYRYTLNIFGQCAKTLIASLTQNLPGVRFQPDNPKDPQDIATSDAAEKLKLIIERNNNINDLMTDAAMKFWTDGRIGFYTRYVTNGQEYGYKDDNYKQPLGQEKIDVYGVLELKVPIAAKKQSQCIFLQCSEEIDIAEAKARYPKYAASIKPGSGVGEDEYDRTARLSVIQGTQLLSQTGDSFANLITHQRTWLRPSAFLTVDDLNVRTQLLELFPNGCVVTFCGRTYVDSRAESMDDHWVLARPVPGDGQNTPSLGQPVVEIQDMINDLVAIRMRTYKFQIPAVWFDPTVIDGDALSSQTSTPGMHYPVKEDHQLGQGVPLANAFYSEPMASISPDLDSWLNQLLGPILQNITGLQPAIFGGADESNETASGIAQLRASSLAQLGPAWNSIKNAYAKMIEQAIKCATNRDEAIETQITRGKTTDIISITPDDLKGNVQCYPDQAEGLPQTLDQKSSAMETLLTQSVNVPALQLLINDPNNIELMREYSGLDDLTIPGADERNKQLSEITELIGSVPIPTAQYHQYMELVKQAKEGGHPPLPKPADTVLYKSSVDIDVDFDDHEIEYATGKDWINSPEGQKCKVEEPEGFLNVRLHLLAHKAEIDKASQLAHQNQLATIQAQHPTKPATPNIKLPTQEVTKNSLTGAVEQKIKDLPYTPEQPQGAQLP